MASSARRRPLVLSREEHEALGADELLTLFQHNQLLLLRAAARAPLWRLEQLAAEWRQTPEWVCREWAVENGMCTPGPRKAADVLGPAPLWPGGSWYCSTILEAGGEHQQAVLSQIGLPTAALRSERVENSEAVWIFAGRHQRVKTQDSSPQPPLPGRGEHVDEVSHSGTWHIQTSGCKIWQVRPNLAAWPDGALPPDWRDSDDPVHVRGKSAERQGRKRKGAGSALDDWHFEGRMESIATLILECGVGDVLLINTRLWFHATSIPPQDDICMSVARDFYIDAPKDKVSGVSSGSRMTNRAGPVAGRDMCEGEEVMVEVPLIAVMPLETVDGEPPCRVCARCAQPLPAVGGHVSDTTSEKDTAQVHNNNIRRKAKPRTWVDEQDRAIDMKSGGAGKDLGPPADANGAIGRLTFCSQECEAVCGGDAASMLHWWGGIPSHLSLGADYKRLARMRRACLLALRSGHWETLHMAMRLVAAAAAGGDNCEAAATIVELRSRVCESETDWASVVIGEVKNEDEGEGEERGEEKSEEAGEEEDDREANDENDGEVREEEDCGEEGEVNDDAKTEQSEDDTDGVDEYEVELYQWEEDWSMTDEPFDNDIARFSPALSANLLLAQSLPARVTGVGSAWGLSLDPFGRVDAVSFAASTAGVRLGDTAVAVAGAPFPASRSSRAVTAKAQRRLLRSIEEALRLRAQTVVGDPTLTSWIGVPWTFSRRGAAVIPSVEPSSLLSAAACTQKSPPKGSDEDGKTPALGVGHAEETERLRQLVLEAGDHFRVAVEAWAMQRHLAQGQSGQCDTHRLQAALEEPTNGQWQQYYSAGAEQKAGPTTEMGHLAFGSSVRDALSAQGWMQLLLAVHTYSWQVDADSVEWEGVRDEVDPQETKQVKKGPTGGGGEVNGVDQDLSPHNLSRWSVRVLFPQLSAVQQIVGVDDDAGAANCSLKLRGVLGAGLRAVLTTAQSVKAGEGLLVSSA